jgi:hypothetical protein
MGSRLQVHGPLPGKMNVEPCPIRKRCRSQKALWRMIRTCITSHSEFSSICVGSCSFDPSMGLCGLVTFASLCGTYITRWDGRQYRRDDHDTSHTTKTTSRNNRRAETKRCPSRCSLVFPVLFSLVPALLSRLRREQHHNALIR